MAVDPSFFRELAPYQARGFFDLDPTSFVRQSFELFDSCSSSSVLFSIISDFTFVTFISFSFSSSRPLKEYSISPISFSIRLISSSNSLASSSDVIPSPDFLNITSISSDFIILICSSPLLTRTSTFEFF
eukprot:UN32394